MFRRMVEIQLIHSYYFMIDQSPLHFVVCRPIIAFATKFEVMKLFKKILLQIAAEVSAPLAKTDEIVLIGGSDRTTQEINKLVGTLPPAIQALTGVDLTGVSSSEIKELERKIKWKKR